MILMREPKPRQILLDLYDEVLRECIRNRYVVHCTDSKCAVDAADQACKEEYLDYSSRFQNALCLMDRRIEELESDIQDMKWENQEQANNEE